jgi:hypothetical protein
MAEYSAFGTTLSMGIKQVETAVVVGTITGNGNATFTVTKSGMTGTPLAVSVAVLAGDTPDTVATKAAAALNANANFLAVLKAVGNGPNVIVTCLTAAANDASMNVAYTNDTCAGLIPDATSNDTTAGVALTAVAQISNIGGPSLSADTEDVTTHDQATAWEENVVTILRSGEVALDLVYDPGAATHAATSGLLARLKNKTPAQFRIGFPSNPAVNWTFDGYSTGFEPGAPVDGALTASAALKVTGQPTLA